jgi:hypothetical protein
MSSLPRVSEVTRETVARELDDLGPDACVAEITRHLEEQNPELLHMAVKCATDLGNVSKIMVGFTAFYRLLMVQAMGPYGLSPINVLPRVTPETRDLLVGQIDKMGSESFTKQAIDDLGRDNPELLQMAHDFASRNRAYLGLMQGFALIYQSLLLQDKAERTWLH